MHRNAGIQHFNNLGSNNIQSSGEIHTYCKLWSFWKKKQHGVHTHKPVPYWVKICKKNFLGKKTGLHLIIDGVKWVCSFKKKKNTTPLSFAFGTLLYIGREKPASNGHVEMVSQCTAMHPTFWDKAANKTGPADPTSSRNNKEMGASVKANGGIGKRQ